MRRRSQISANQAQAEQAQAAAPLTMSIGENTRKPVAAASAMPRTIDNAKSDIEAPAYPAYNNSAIAGLVLADAGRVIVFRWRWRGTADPIRLGAALARRRPIQLSHTPSSRPASTTASIACMHVTSLRRLPSSARTSSSRASNRPRSRRRDRQASRDALEVLWSKVFQLTETAERPSRHRHHVTLGDLCAR
jgi:hypothetical protein